MIFSFGIEFLNTSFDISEKSFGNNKFDFFITTYCPISDITYISYFILGYFLHKKFYYSNLNTKLNKKT